MISTFWFNLDNFETTNKTLILSPMATFYDCRRCQLHKDTWPRGIKLAHILLAKAFACRTVLIEGASCSKLHKGTVWVSSCFVSLQFFCFLFINENNSRNRSKNTPFKKTWLIQNFPSIRLHITILCATVYNFFYCWRSYIFFPFL